MRVSVYARGQETQTEAAVTRSKIYAKNAAMSLKVAWRSTCYAKVNTIASAKINYSPRFRGEKKEREKYREGGVRERKKEKEREERKE